MSEIKKSVNLNSLSEVGTTNGMYTFGTTDFCSRFDQTKTYEIGDCVTVGGSQPTDPDVNVRFIKHHNTGPFVQTEAVVASITPSSVKMDMSFISNGSDQLDYDISHKEEGQYIYSIGKEGRFADYTIKVMGEEASFDPSGILITAVDTLSADATIMKRTDKDGICVLSLLKDRTYEITAEKREGWQANSPSGEKFMMFPNITNYVPKMPTDFISSWTYHVGEKTTYNGTPYIFTSNHTGAWNQAHAQRTTIRENVLEFRYRKCSEETVHMKLVTEYSGGRPLSAQTVLAFAGDMSMWSSGVTNASGEWEFDMPKNMDCNIFCPSSMGWDYGNRFYDITTVSDRNKTIHATYPTGLYWVCGETPESIADGTAWQEFKLEDFPFDEPDTWVKTGSRTVDKPHPVKHPCVLLHVATEELVSRKFDHRNMPLSAASDDPIRVTASDQVFPWKDRPYDASYYIRIADLTDERSSDVTTGRQWCSQNLLHPHVTTSCDYNVLSSYDGALMTSWIKYDSDNMLVNGTAAVAASSQAANYALSQTAQLGSRELSGFIGTYMQMNPLFLLSEPIYYGLSKFGYVGNFKTGIYWWTGTQNNHSSVTYWYSTKWDLYLKYNSSKFIPFYL